MNISGPDVTEILKNLSAKRFARDEKIDSLDDLFQEAAFQTSEEEVEQEPEELDFDY